MTNQATNHKQIPDYGDSISMKHGHIKITPGRRLARGMEAVQNIWNQQPGNVSPKVSPKASLLVPPGEKSNSCNGAHSETQLVEIEGFTSSKKPACSSVQTGPMENIGFEPVTYWLPASRSAN